MDSRPSSPQLIPSVASKIKIPKSAPTGFSSCSTGPGLSSTGERSVGESNVFERVPIPSKSSLQSQKPLSALGSILTESSKPEVTDAASWMKASFGTGRTPSPGVPDNSEETTATDYVADDFSLSPLQIPVSQQWSCPYPVEKVTSPSDNSVISPAHKTLPRMSREPMRPQLARRSFSTKISKSPGTILVKRQGSDVGRSNQSSISPVTSESFSSIGMSPAVSFLSSLVEQPFNHTAGMVELNNSNS
jgi:hypothetical protein